MSLNVLEKVKGKTFMKKDGSVTSADDVFAKHKVICLYFSAHWCPPCRGFTPVLKDFYEELEELGDFTVVFVSSDKTSKDAESYFTESHGDYFMLPFEDTETVGNVKTLCGVSGIPYLCVFKSDGTLITKEGRRQVQSGNPRKTREEWLKN